MLFVISYWLKMSELPAFFFMLSDRYAMRVVINQALVNFTGDHILDIIHESCMKINEKLE